MSNLSKMSLRISLIIMLCLATSCDTEKDLLHSYRKAGLEILFDPTGGNPSRRKDLVRNGIPVPIKVMLYSDKFGDQDVTEKVKDNWQYLDPKLGKVLYDDSTMSAYYLHDSTNVGHQKITTKLENYVATKEFDIAPVEFIEIPGDTFLMGSDGPEADDDEKPPHQVMVNNFWISKYEVTNLEYKAFLKDAKDDSLLQYLDAHIQGFYTTDKVNNLEKGLLCLGTTESLIKYENRKIEITPSFENHPVIGVTWVGAFIFAAYYGLRLPTEAEWEYACKGKTRNEYPDGSKANLPEYAWFNDNSEYILHEVGKKKKNDFNLYDIHGNVYEWCFDQYSPYDSTDFNNPIGHNDNELFRVVRGGSYKSNADECRSTNREECYREAYWLIKPEFVVGFRVVSPYEM